MMITLAKQAMEKATNEMMKEAGKKAGKYVTRVAVIGGAAITGNYVAHKTKEKGIELTKNIEKSIKNGSQEIADIIQGNKDIEPIKAGVKIVKGVGKAAAVTVVAGAGAVAAAKITGYVRDTGKDLSEELAADYRKVKYFVEEDIDTDIDAAYDEIEYL